ESDVAYITEYAVHNVGNLQSADGDERDATASAPNDNFALLSWCVGVAFGRFDWRLATGKREAPAEPDPFDPLPAKSPGMLPNGTAPLHVHSGILVDDPGHPHDLSRLIEDVLAIVHQPATEDVRRWLQRDFFPHHLKQYSKRHAAWRLAFAAPLGRHLAALARTLAGGGLRLRLERR